MPKTEFYETGVEVVAQMDLLNPGDPTELPWDAFLFDADLTLDQDKDIAKVLSREIHVSHQILVKVQHAKQKDRMVSRHWEKGLSSELPNEAEKASKEPPPDGTGRPISEKARKAAEKKVLDINRKNHPEAGNSSSRLN